MKAIPAQSLSELSRVDHELARRRLEGQLADYRFKTHLLPISNRSGFHIQFPELPRLMSPRTVQDFQNYIDRLNDFPRYASDQTKLLQLGIDAGLTQPAIIMRDAVKQAAAHIVSDPTESLLYKNVIAEARRHLSADEFAELDKSIRAAITTSVVPTYRDFSEFLKQQYLPACRGPIGASALPAGREFYRDRVRYFTTIEITPEELHETGLNENSRIRGEMEAIRQSVDFAGDLDAFLTHLRTDKQFYAQTPEELLQSGCVDSQACRRSAARDLWPLAAHPVRTC